MDEQFYGFLQNLFFFINFANRIITVGSLGVALVAPCRGSYVNYNTFCMLRRCRCVNNRISVANLCKLQYFLYVASLPLFSKGFQLKAVDFSIPGRSRPGPALRIDAFLKDFSATSFRTLMAHSTRDIHNVGQPTLHMHYGQGMG